MSDPEFGKDQVVDSRSITNHQNQTQNNETRHILDGARSWAGRNAAFMQSVGSVEL
jgi:hypothetical protein